MTSAAEHPGIDNPVLTRNVSSVSRAVALIGASLCCATIIVEQPAELLAAANAAEISCGNTLNQLVGQTLVIPLAVVTLDVRSSTAYTVSVQ